MEHDGSGPVGRCDDHWGAHDLGSSSVMWFEPLRVSVTCMGGDGELNPMQVLLAALAGCDVHLVAMHAALLGVTIESRTVEARGHFNVVRLPGASRWSPAQGMTRSDAGSCSTPREARDPGKSAPP